MKIKLILEKQMGSCQCHHGHKPGDVFEWPKDRGDLCPMAAHVAFPYVDILRYGGEPPRCGDGTVKFCCPDPDVVNVFRIETDK